MSDQIRVLVVDDSSLVRKIITDILESDPMIKVIGTANNGKTAIYKNTELNPDVITLDIEMPILDGLSALQTIMETNPKPVIMMSVLTQHGAEATFKALDMGAVDFIPKPSSVLSITVDEIGELLISKVKSVHKSNFRITKREYPEKDDTLTHEAHRKPEPDKIFHPDFKSFKVVGIGTSTGGPAALINIFKEFPKNFPSPVLVVQHMPEGFTHAFAERLNSCSNLTVKEGENFDVVLPGHAYIAPGHSHMFLEKKGDELRILLSKGDKRSGHRPSIDVLFDSLAENIGHHTIGVIMTGMGKDGSEGILKIREKGGYTLAQDEKTSVVYGMNRVAVENNAIVDIVPLNQITKKIVENI